MSGDPNFGDWKDFGSSIFTDMTLLAQRHHSVNLAQGFPDFEAPQGVLNAASKAILEGKNQYAPSIGIKALREALSSHYRRHFHAVFDPDKEITIFSGATEAIWCAVGALVKPDEEVLLLAPTFDIYPAAVFGAKAKVRIYALNEIDWTIDFDELEKKISPATKAIIINNPMNPLGKVFSRNELESLAEVAIKYDLTVISDEVYDHLVFEPYAHIPIHSLPGMRERTVTVSSAAKTYSLTGWKVGYAFASAVLTSKIRTIHQFTVFCSATPLQWGLAWALDQEDSEVALLRETLAQRRIFLNDLLEKVGFKPSPCQAGYFITASFAHLSDKKDLDYAIELTQKSLVATIPLSSFYFQRERTGWLRFAFCKKQETLDAAAKNLNEAAIGRRN